MHRPADHPRGLHDGMSQLLGARRAPWLAGLFLLIGAVGLLFFVAHLQEIKFSLWPVLKFEHYIAVLRETGSEWSVGHSEDVVDGPEGQDRAAKSSLMRMDPSTTLPWFLSRLRDSSEHIKVREVAWMTLADRLTWLNWPGASDVAPRLTKEFFLALWAIFANQSEPQRIRQPALGSLEQWAWLRRGILAADTATGRPRWLSILVDGRAPLDQRQAAMRILDKMRQDVRSECLQLLRVGATPAALRLSVYHHLRQFSGHAGFGLDEVRSESWWASDANARLAADTIEAWFKNNPGGEFGRWLKEGAAEPDPFISQ